MSPCNISTKRRPHCWRGFAAVRLGAVMVLAAWTLTAAAARADINVAVSIKPIHSLVAAVMRGAGAPDLIVQGAGSPHAYALKPSQAVKLARADVVFWMGPELEAFLEKSLRTIAGGGRSVALLDAPGLIRRRLREDGNFEHEEHHGEHEEHHEEKERHGKTGEETHDHDHDHGDAGYDAHVWLDPRNASTLVRAILAALSDADPARAAAYAANAARLTERLTALENEVAELLSPVRGRPFVVFHDAYLYFEKRFGMTAVGSIAVSPETVPGIQRIRKIRATVKSLKAACVFAEPQFEPKLVAVVTEGTAARSGVLDPLGAGLADGPDLYFKLIGNMADAFRACLSEGS